MCESIGDETVIPIRLYCELWFLKANARLIYPGITVARLKLKRIGGVDQTVEYVV